MVRNFGIYLLTGIMIFVFTGTVFAVEDEASKEILSDFNTKLEQLYLVAEPAFTSEGMSKIRKYERDAVDEAKADAGASLVGQLQETYFSKYFEESTTGQDQESISRIKSSLKMKMKGTLGGWSKYGRNYYFKDKKVEHVQGGWKVKIKVVVSFSGEDLKRILKTSIDKVLNEGGKVVCDREIVINEDLEARAKLNDKEREVESLKRKIARLEKRNSKPSYEGKYEKQIEKLKKQLEDSDMEKAGLRKKIEEIQAEVKEDYNDNIVNSKNVSFDKDKPVTGLIVDARKNELIQSSRIEISTTDGYLVYWNCNAYQGAVIDQGMSRYSGSDVDKAKIEQSDFIGDNPIVVKAVGTYGFDRYKTNIKISDNDAILVFYEDIKNGFLERARVLVLMD